MPTSLVDRATTWSSKLLENIDQEYWGVRPARNNYQNVIVHPGITQILDDISDELPYSNRVLDVGIGDGSVGTFYLREQLEKRNFSGTLFGYDPNSNLIEKAIHAIPSESNVPLFLGSGSFKQFSQIYRIENQIELATSFFYVQEIPNLDAHLQSMNNVLKKEEARYVAFLMHPTFGEAMHKKKALKLREGLSPKDNDFYRFAAEFPVVEEGREPFFAPYFHRTVDDYIEAFSNHFETVNILSLGVPDNRRIEVENQEMPPFYKFKENVFYPEILDNSTLLILAKK